MRKKTTKPLGIILAAGRGSRMGAATASRPKCLVELGGQSLLQWQLSALRAAGIDEPCIVRGYQRNAIQAAGCRYRDNPRWAHANMVRSLLCARDLLANREAVICYSDIVFHPHHLERLITANGEIRITYDISWAKLWRQRFTRPLEDAESFIHDGGRLLQIGSKVDNISIIQGQYMGLTAITPEGWRKLLGVLDTLSAEEQNSLDMTSLFSLALKKGIDINVIPVDGKWCEVDTENDLSLYHKLLAAPPGQWKHDWRW
ncbi:phosphocholine cytidylyltransferase family protein [Thiolapillus sp.]